MIQSFLEFASKKKYTMEDAISQSMASPIGPKKLYLLFPKDEFEEFAYRIFNKLGIVSVFFHSLEEANRELQRIKSTGFIADEVVIQTHGTSLEIMVTMEDKEMIVGYKSDEIEGSNYVDTLPSTKKWFKFLGNIKGVINPNSKVIFTSCDGGYFLHKIKRAAEFLGCKVYAQQGKYYPARNYSEGGWFQCNPLPKVDKPWPLKDNKELLDSKLCLKCETPIGWMKWLIPSGH